MNAMEIISPMSDKDAQILELFRQLTPEQKQALTCLAQVALSSQQQDL